MVEKPCLDGHRVRSLGGGFIRSGKRIADFLSGESLILMIAVILYRRNSHGATLSM